MRILVQRVKNASVKVDNIITGEIENGLLCYVGFKVGDNIENIKYLAKKLVNLRIFEDENEKLNLSVKDVNGAILSVSQFTLYANTSHGNRPSFTDALNPIDAKRLYEIFNDEVKNLGVNVEAGIFQAMMDVNYTNYGPVTIMLERE